MRARPGTGAVSSLTVDETAAAGRGKSEGPRRHRRHPGASFVSSGDRQEPLNKDTVHCCRGHFRDGQSHLSTFAHIIPLPFVVTCEHLETLQAFDR